MKVIEQEREWKENPEEARAKWNQYVRPKYEKLGQQAVAELEKQQRMMRTAATIGEWIGFGTAAVVAAGFALAAATSYGGVAGTYSLTTPANTAATAVGGAGAVGGAVNRIEQVAPVLDEVPEVTVSVARDAMAEAPLLSQQGSVYLPKVREYVQLLQQGIQKVDPIKVGNGIIVEGHHRYVASRILGIDIPIQEWTSGRYSLPWNLVEFLEK
jgi:hypothetical protein